MALSGTQRDQIDTHGDSSIPDWERDRTQMEENNLRTSFWVLIVPNWLTWLRHFWDKRLFIYNIKSTYYVVILCICHTIPKKDRSTGVFLPANFHGVGRCPLPWMVLVGHRPHGGGSKNFAKKPKNCKKDGILHKRWQFFLRRGGGTWGQFFPVCFLPPICLLSFTKKEQFSSHLAIFIANSVWPQNLIW